MALGLVVVELSTCPNLGVNSADPMLHSAVLGHGADILVGLVLSPKSAFMPASPGRAEAGNPTNEAEQKEVASIAPAKAGTAADIVFDAVINAPAKLAVDAAGERSEQASSPTRPGAAASPAAPAAPPATAAEAVLDALINTPSKMVSEAMAYGQAISPYGMVMDALGGLLG